LIALHDFLEDFGSAVGAAALAEPAGPVVDEAEVEGMKLESFENGYRAGWDDAVKAQSDDKTRISSAFGQHLQDLSFTYHEASRQVMNSMTPLLHEIVASLLPEVARASLGQHIVEQLQNMAEELGELEVVVAVSPNNVEAVQPLLQGDFGFPVELTADDTLLEEQADIRLGDTEKQIDLGDLVASVSEAIQGFTHDNRRKVEHG